MNNYHLGALGFTQLAALAQQLRVGLVMTASPLPVDEDWSVAQALAFLKDNHFDQAPVSCRGQIVGLVKRTVLEARPHGQSVASSGFEQLKPDNTIDESAVLTRLLNKLADQPSCLVVDDDEQVVGLAHISDLNRQPVRFYFYMLFTALEMALACLIAEHFPDEERWLELLSGNSRHNIRSRYREAENKRMELTNLEFAGFPDLLEILGQTSDLQTGWMQAEDLAWFDDYCAFRNVVMHTVKPAVTDQASAAALRDRSRALRGLLRRLERKLSGQTSTTH